MNQNFHHPKTAFYSVFRRNCVGEFPVFSVNAVMKLTSLRYPTRNAISLTERLVDCSNAFASSILCSIIYSCGEKPVVLRNKREKWEGLRLTASATRRTDNCSNRCTPINCIALAIASFSGMRPCCGFGNSRLQRIR